MSTKYRVRNHEAVHFLTMTIVDWVDIFSREVYKVIITESLRYCQEFKGLDLYAFCIMTNHIHLLASSRLPDQLPDFVRDFKKFTNKKIIKTIFEEPENRREWMMYRFRFHAKYNRRIKDYKVWYDGYHSVECYDMKVITQKLNYIHQNPVKAGIVSEAEHYIYSSASNYAGKTGILDVIFI